MGWLFCITNCIEIDFSFSSLFFTFYSRSALYSYIYYYYMQYHSSISLRLNFTVESNQFLSYYIYKDITWIFSRIIFLFTFCFLFPECLITCNQLYEANPSRTPPHIVPEWYFLPFLCNIYAVFQINLVVVLYLMFFYFYFVTIPFARI